MHSLALLLALAVVSTLATATTPPRPRIYFPRKVKAARDIAESVPVASTISASTVAAETPGQSSLLSEVIDILSQSESDTQTPETTNPNTQPAAGTGASRNTVALDNSVPVNTLPATQTTPPTQDANTNARAEQTPAQTSSSPASGTADPTDPVLGVGVAPDVGLGSTNGGQQSFATTPSTPAAAAETGAVTNPSVNNVGTAAHTRQEVALPSSQATTEATGHDPVDVAVGSNINTVSVSSAQQTQQMVGQVQSTAPAAATATNPSLVNTPEADSNMSASSTDLPIVSGLVDTSTNPTVVVNAQPPSSAPSSNPSVATTQAADSSTSADSADIPIVGGLVGTGTNPAAVNTQPPSSAPSSDGTVVDTSAASTNLPIVGGLVGTGTNPAAVNTQPPSSAPSSDGTVVDISAASTNLPIVGGLVGTGTNPAAVNTQPPSSAPSSDGTVDISAASTNLPIVGGLVGTGTNPAVVNTQPPSSTPSPDRTVVDTSAASANLSIVGGLVGTSTNSLAVNTQPAPTSDPLDVELGVGVSDDVNQSTDNARIPATILPSGTGGVPVNGPLVGATLSAVFTPTDLAPVIPVLSASSGSAVGTSPATVPSSGETLTGILLAPTGVVTPSMGSLSPTNSPSNDDSNKRLRPTIDATALPPVPTSYAGTGISTATPSNPTFAPTDFAKLSQPLASAPLTASASNTPLSSLYPSGLFGTGVTRVTASEATTSPNAPLATSAPSVSSGATPTSATEPSFVASPSLPPPALLSTSSAPARSSVSILSSIPLTSIPAISTFSNSVPLMPTTVIAETSSQPATSRLPSTFPTAMPTSLPKAITPDSASDQVPDDSVTIRIGFGHGLNYPFVVGNSKGAAQIFQLLPKALAYAGSIDIDSLSVRKLVPLDTQSSLGFITTLAYVTYPQEKVDALRIDMKIPSSTVYTQDLAPSSERTLLQDFTSNFNPAIDIILGSVEDGSSGDSTDNNSSLSSNEKGPNSNSNNPLTGEFESPPETSSAQKGTTAGITVGAFVAAGAYGAAMFVIARRYKRRKQGHRRSSSVTGSSEQPEMQAAPGSPPMMGGALMSRDFSAYASGDGRGCRGSGPSTAGSGLGHAQIAYISAPVSTGNSLGWN